MKNVSCDRCQKDISKAYNSFSSNDYKIFEYGSPSERKYADLCGKCFADTVYQIKQWLTGKTK